MQTEQTEQTKNLTFSQLGKINLKQRLKQAGISQKQLATELGVSYSAVSLWCRKKSVPDRQRTYVIEALGKARTEQPRTVIRRSKSKTKSKPKSPYFVGYRDALTAIETIFKVPTTDETRMNLIREFVKAPLKSN